ncbi:OLC1v1016336C1 [Oldenlandia corymbosa var. corymbosa]|uniref:OLC1v1016336C1 n=1 Tax=Oldenlandia corymbosa var. corymbosa TaxID=529605 RepID=A0AAV1E5H6_OLDCO|nr:OLC1v1016336C1 [Oldenlandia corymbosa var. corymbosa]
MAGDGSFKKQGAIPFKWEIRPGVPKDQAQQPGHVLHREHNKAFSGQLATPPGRLQLQPRMEARTRSLLSTPRALSDRFSSHKSMLSGPDIFYPGGCLPSLYKQPNLLNVKPESEPDRNSDLEARSPLSSSSRRKSSSSSPSRDSSPVFSSTSYRRSSPPAMVDAEWAGVGLF